MQLTRVFAALAAFATVALLFAAPASAQATRTWVSGVGDDANPCSRTAPCKTFAGAIGKTAANGEIDCLDPGGFGAVTITKAITIDCTAAGNIGGVLVSGTNGIVISAGSTDHVQLIGLYIDGLNTGLNGVNILSPTNVAIVNCYIFGFGGQAANPPSSPGSAGVLVAGAGARVLVENSIIRNNVNGVVVSVSGGITQIENSILDGNQKFNLNMFSTGGKAFLNHSTLTGSAAIGNSATPASVVESTGTNFIFGAGAPTATIAPQ